MANPLIERLNELLESSTHLVFAAGHETYKMSAENLPPKALRDATRHCIAQLKQVEPRKVEP